MDNNYNSNADKAFARLTNTIGKDEARYCMCAVFNKPYTDAYEHETWSEYLALLPNDGSKFTDGTTDRRASYDNPTTQLDEWKSIWGIGSEEHPYSTDDYKRMDKLFKTYSERLNASGGMDAQQEDTIRSCVKMRLLADKSLASGTKDGVAMNTQLNKTIQDNLSAENLRKKDAKPIEIAKVDGIVDALTKKYGANVFVSYDEAVAICSKWLTSHHYPMTMDAAEHVLLSIINCMRVNNDMPEVSELPKEIKFDAKMATEFEELPNDLETDAYEYLGIKPFSKEPFANKDGDLLG